MKRKILDDILIGNSGARYENVEFCGKVTVGEEARGVSFIGCSFAALLVLGKDASLVSSTVCFDGVGVEAKADGLLVRDCRFEGTGTAILATAEGADIRDCRFALNEAGTAVAMVGATNAILALSAVTGAKRALVMENCFNCVAVKNELPAVYAEGGRHLYICDNTLSDRLYAKDVNYLLADGNEYPADGADHAAVCAGNQNTNGDTVTDVDARLEVGANEDLLPHVDRDLFVGMERRKSVKEYGVGDGLSVYDYLMARAVTDEYVIFAPGVYATDHAAILTEAHKNTTVYAYGVFVEHIEYPDKNNTHQHLSIRASGSGTTAGKQHPFLAQPFLQCRTQ